MLPFSVPWQRKSILVGALVLALAVVAGVVLTSGGSGSSRRGPEFGFADQTEGTTRLQAELAAPVRRIVVGWDQIEPAPGVWRWAIFDRAYSEARRAGLRPLFVAAGSPCWAHPRIVCAPWDDGGSPPDRAYDPAWATFVRRLASRYPDSAGIEIWNEENLQPQFLPYPNAARYTQLLQEAFRAVRSVSRRMPVISGGLFVSPRSGPYGVSDARFLAAMFAAGAKDFMDGVGVHIYPDAAGGLRPAAVVGKVERTLDRIREVSRAAHDASVPLWITELGLTTEAAAGSPSPVSPEQQAADLVAIVRDLRRDRDIGAVMIHTLIDSPGAGLPGDPPGFGVFYTNGSPKPAACALSAVFHGRLRC